jgi:Cft2 family RNA processing exonuclease
MIGGEDCPQIFSAASLEERFDHPRGQKRGTNIGGIHKALMKAFSEGHIITFVDDGGSVLRETDIVVPGSKAIGQPQIFGRPGAVSPDANFHPVTYEETIRRGIDYSDNGAADADAAEEIMPEAGADVTADGGEPPGEPAPSMTAEEARKLLRGYPPPDMSAPGFLDDRLLRLWVSLPEVCKWLSHGLDIARGPDKYELIRAGITRKQRVWRSDSTIAGNLVTLCRRSPVLWANVVRSAMKHYLTGDAGAKLLGELGEFAADPLDFYEKSEHPPDAIVLLALAMDVDEVELLAADCASELSEQKVVDKTAAQEQRIQLLEAETVELRRQAKDREKELRTAAKEQRELEAANARLREAAERDGDADKVKVAADEKLRKRAETADAKVEKLEGERIPELEAQLEAQLEALDVANDRLEAVEDDLRSERLLRTQAEQDAARLNARVRVLTDDLSRASDSRNLPTENATALLDALLRPIGQAARHAAERLANGRPKPHDELLLELAAGVAQMSRRLDTDAERDSIEPVDAAEKSAAEATARPADTESSEVVVSDADAGAEIVELPATPVAEPEPADPEPAAAPELRRPLRARRAKLKVRPLGGAGEVGGSAILVTNNSGHSVLLDCGQRVRGEYGLDTEPPFHRSIGQDGRLHAILLSHAHIDHVGSLPVLHRLQSEAQHEPIPVYMTEPTRRLAQIMLEDSAKIQQFREIDEAEVGFLDYGVGTMEAAYRLADVNRVLDDEFVRDVTPGLAVPIPGTSFVARFIPVAHVLGSCAIHLTDIENDQTLLYTGDLGPISAPQATLPQYSLADMLAAHLVIMESTYGSQGPELIGGRRARRSLSPREGAVKVLCRRAEHAYDNGGVMLLPAFSLGRTQELAMLIEHAKRDGQAPPGDIIVAGMGEKLTQVYENYSRGTNAWARAEDMPRVDELGGRLRKHPDLRFDDVVGEVLDGGFSYVIASPAMLSSGWSRSFLTQMVDNPAHAVVMSGYVPRHGGKIPRLHQLHKGDTLDLGNGLHRIQCEFDQLKGLSAHAPAVDLHQFAKYMARQGDNVAFAMVHGDDASQRALAEDVAELPGVASAKPLYNGDIWQPTRP